MRRLAALAAATVALLALSAPAAAYREGSLGDARLLSLVLHRARMHTHRSAPLRITRHQLLRALPSVEHRRPAPRSQPAPQPKPKPAPQPKPTQPAGGAQLSAAERALVEATNRVRAAYGLRPLTASAGLSAAANAHSVEMLKRGYFDHDSANGDDFSVRLARYYPRTGHWSVGENIAYGCPDLSVDEAMDLWMHSAGHRANILHSSWTDVGVAIVHADAAPGPDYQGDPTTVITVDFGHH